MPTYFRKTIKILPWVTLNINKSGVSVSIGPRGAKLNIGKKGAYFNTNIRGTGISNKTKVSTSLLWALGFFVVLTGIGWLLWRFTYNIDYLLTLFAIGLVGGIALFFFVRNIKRRSIEEEEVLEEEEEATASTKKSSTKKGRKKTANIPTRSTKNGTRTSGRTAKRADNASADAYLDEVQKLMETMAATNNIEELKDTHSKILDILYTNVKPLGVKVFEMEFDDALAVIEQEYAEGLKQLSE